MGDRSMKRSPHKKPWQRWWRISLFIFFILIILLYLGAKLLDYTPEAPLDYEQFKTSNPRYAETTKLWGGVVKIVIAPCGEANAFYSPQTNQITMCEELAYDIALTLAPEIKRTYDDPAQVERELTKQVSGALYAVYLHEVAHALIANYQLPITGREEDVADQISFYIHTYYHHEEDILPYARWYLLQPDPTYAENLPFSDEHGLNKQRYYNLICWVYGTNTTKYAYLVTEGTLPESRAERCSYESYQVMKGGEHLYGLIAQEEVERRGLG